MSKLMLIASALVLLLSGCGTMTNRYAPEKWTAAAPAEGTGLILFSTGAPERCTMAATFLKLLPEGKPYHFAETALPSVDAYVLKSDFADHQGNLHLIPVPAGQYYFAPWTANPYLVPTKVPKASFSVAAGEIVYLGEYFMPVACSTTTLGRISDQKQRDLALLKSKNPNVDTTHVVTRLMVFNGEAM